MTDRDALPSREWVRGQIDKAAVIHERIEEYRFKQAAATAGAVEAIRDKELVVPVRVRTRVTVRPSETDPSRIEWHLSRWQRLRYRIARWLRP